MRAQLSKLGYDIRHRVLSPHEFDVPQIRERLFIIGSRHGLGAFAWPIATKRPLTIDSVLDSRPPEAKALSIQAENCLQVWQEFLDRSPRNIELPSFPVWSMEFGADYPFEDCTPYQLGTRSLIKYKGSHGVPLRGLPPALRMDALPSYARSASGRFPSWKVQFIRQNRKFFSDNKRWIKPWIKKILEFPPSLQKFEWNCKGEVRDIWRYVLQFRASGVRVKRKTTAPSLVAMTTTQVPIIAWEHRYMTPRECARLQSLDRLRLLPVSATGAYRALGNAVNAKIVGLIGERLLPRKGTTKRSGQVVGVDELVA
jgi:DNA (cytosine-5)-methyltransferase 1